MAQDREAHKDYLDFYNRFGNSVVTPAVRAFCREMGFGFHFWDELPKEAFDPRIGDAEMNLWPEMLNLFNELKPEFVAFEDNVVRYRFVSWEEYDYEKWPVSEFLEKFVCKPRKPSRRIKSRIDKLREKFRAI